MNFLDQGREFETEKLLGKYTSGVTAAGRGRWSCVLQNGKPRSVTARVEGGFLMLDAAAGFCGAASNLPDLAEWNANLQGACKFALVPSPWRVRLRAEIALPEEVDLASRLRENLEGFETGFRRIHEGLSGEAARAISAACTAKAGPAATGSLLSLLAETQWPFKERLPGVVAVDLESRTGFHQAVLEERGGGIGTSVELARICPAGEASRQALVVLMLTLNGAVRLVRGILAQSSGQLTCGLEAGFGTTPNAAEIDHALAALSVACRICGRGVNVLLDEAVARQYLAVRNIPSTIGEQEN